MTNSKKKKIHFLATFSGASWSPNEQWVAFIAESAPLEPRPFWKLKEDSKDDGNQLELGQEFDYDNAEDW